MKLFGEKRLVKSVKLLNIKSINPIQKYPHITESCILKILTIKLLLITALLISLGICSIPKLSKYTTALLFT